jgi:hypothetical protein
MRLAFTIVPAERGIPTQAGIQPNKFRMKVLSLRIALLDIANLPAQLHFLICLSLTMAASMGSRCSN